MCCRIAELRNKNVVCVKNGCVLGYINDVQFDTVSGSLQSVVIPGRLRLFGILGREEDIIIPWSDITVIGQETVLVSTDPGIYNAYPKKGRFRL